MARIGTIRSNSTNNGRGTTSKSNIEKNDTHAAKLGLSNKNPLISSIAVLAKNPMRDDSLRKLYEIAERVSYLMKQESFQVFQLVEFYPKDKCLLGMNVNRGAKIMIRLRSPNDEFQFLPMESLMGTMLHELTHNIFGPHDNKFYNKLDDLSSKQWSNDQKGLVNTFLGQGKQVGIGINRHANSVSTGSTTNNKVSKTTAKKRGLVLGGAKPVDFSLKSPREMARIAAERRLNDNKWCAHNVGESEVTFQPEGSEPDVIVLDDEEKLLSQEKQENYVKLIELSSDDEAGNALEKADGDSSHVIILDD